MLSRVLLYAIIGLLALQLVRSLFRPRLPRSGGGPRPVRGPSEEVLVRDPQCGIYLPRAAGIKRNVRGEDHYFCSNECLESFESRRGA